MVSFFYIILILINYSFFNWLNNLFNVFILKKKIRVGDETKSFIVGSIGSSEIFGEISFVQVRGATASVVAESDEVQVVIIEGYYIKRLMEIYPSLAGRFLLFICSILQRRVNQKIRFEDQDELRVVDLIAEPLHHNLIKLPVLPPTSLNPIKVINGPNVDESIEKLNFQTISSNQFAATSITTYPKRIYTMKNLNPDTGEEETITRISRDGHPICDQFNIQVFPQRIIFAIADGCNWGEAPRNAARAAVNGFTRYLSKHQCEIRDIQYAGGLVLRGLSMANAEIFVGLDPESQVIGTTTFLGGIVLPIGFQQNQVDLKSDKDDSPASPSPIHAALPPNLNNGLMDSNFAFIYVSLGDCKAFHWSSESGKFSDITASNRVNSLSASDCGGRLGPHEVNNLPDLRNLELGFFPCHTGDCIILVSDGVHDNLDLDHLGLTTSELGIPYPDWESVPPEQYQILKNDYRVYLLQKIITNPETITREELYYGFKANQKAASVKQIPEAPVIVSRLLNHCERTCAAAVKWMRDNPQDKLPSDYVLYPGKMDHTTCLCTFVPNVL